MTPPLLIRRAGMVYLLLSPAVTKKTSSAPVHLFTGYFSTILGELTTNVKNIICLSVCLSHFTFLHLSFVLVDKYKKTGDFTNTEQQIVDLFNKHIYGRTLHIWNLTTNVKLVY